METNESVLEMLRLIDRHTREASVSSGFTFLVVLIGVLYAILKTGGLGLWYVLAIFLGIVFIYSRLVSPR